MSCKELYQMGVVVLYGDIRILAIEPNFCVSITGGNILNGFLWAEVFATFTYICIYVPFILLLHTAISVLSSVFNIASKFYTKYTYFYK